MTRQTLGTLILPSYGAAWKVHEDLIYGDYRGNVIVSSDGWANIKRIIDIGARIGCIYVTDNGTIIVGTRENPGRIYRISSDGTITTPITHKAGCYSREWSINGHGNKVVVGAYGQKGATNPEDNAREVYLSVDDGQTFEIIYQTPALAPTHIHAVAIDAQTNDIWVSNGDSPTSTIRKLKSPNWEPEIIGAYQPTAIIAKHSRYVLFGTDFCVPQNGIFRYDRETEIMEQIFAFPEQYDLPVYSSFYDNETQTAYFGTAQTMTREGHEWKIPAIWKSNPPYNDWEIVDAANGNEYAVYKSIAGDYRAKLVFNREEGSLSLPNEKTYGYFLSEPYRK